MGLHLGLHHHHHIDSDYDRHHHHHHDTYTSTSTHTTTNIINNNTPGNANNNNNNNPGSLINDNNNSNQPNHNNNNNNNNQPIGGGNSQNLPSNQNSRNNENNPSSANGVYQTSPTSESGAAAPLVYSYNPSKSEDADSTEMVFSNPYLIVGVENLLLYGELHDGEDIVAIVEQDSDGLGSGSNHEGNQANRASETNAEKDAPSAAETLSKTNVPVEMANGNSSNVRDVSTVAAINSTENLPIINAHDVALAEFPAKNDDIKPANPLETPLNSTVIKTPN